MRARTTRGGVAIFDFPICGQGVDQSARVSEDAKTIFMPTCRLFTSSGRISLAESYGLPPFNLNWGQGMHIFRAGMISLAMCTTVYAGVVRLGPTKKCFDGKSPLFKLAGVPDGTVKLDIRMMLNAPGFFNGGGKVAYGGQKTLALAPSDTKTRARPRTALRSRRWTPGAGNLRGHGHEIVPLEPLRIQGTGRRTSGPAPGSPE